MSCEYSDSSCCKTGATLRRAKMSPGSRSTGRRLIVAVAAPVTMLVAPGPIDEVQANVCRRVLGFVEPVATCSLACRLPGWEERKGGVCWRAWPGPARVASPDIAKPREEN